MPSTMMSILANSLLALAPAPDTAALLVNADGNRDLVQSHALWCTRSAPGPETHAPPQGVSGQNVLGSMTSRTQDEDCRFVESAADAFPWFPPPGCPFKI
ncbi:hypothetical protein C8R45DRAFT_1113729 [Mycena sanguinolenta]|nr:hypothetical protein C8R45DRAFT_1113729 [Mycena sanguinolenta]